MIRHNRLFDTYILLYDNHNSDQELFINILKSSLSTSTQFLGGARLTPISLLSTKISQVDKYSLKTA